MQMSSSTPLHARFEFVIDNENKRSQITKHAAHEGHRRKLWRKYWSLVEQKPNFLLTREISPQIANKQAQNSETRHISTITSNKLASSTPIHSQFYAQNHMSDGSHIGLLPVFGARRRDCFNSYPFQISRLQEQLLDEYIHHPNCGVFGFAKNFRPHPIRILVQDGIACPILFHAVLANAAYNRLLRCDRSIEVQRVLKCELLSHKIQAIRLSNAALHLPFEKSLNSVLHTALTIAHLECKNNDRIAMMVHYEGIQGILRQLQLIHCDSRASWRLLTRMIL